MDKLEDIEVLRSAIRRTEADIKSYDAPYYWGALVAVAALLEYYSQYVFKYEPTLWPALLVFAALLGVFGRDNSAAKAKDQANLAILKDQFERTKKEVTSGAEKYEPAQAAPHL